MATQRTIKDISVRKRRNYSKDMIWTQELNRDLYELYLQARANPESGGYIKTLKKLWDEKHKEFDHLSASNLAQQGRHCVKRFAAVQDHNEQDEDPEIDEAINSDNEDTIVASSSISPITAH